jgi:hypothetical protein
MPSSAAASEWLGFEWSVRALAQPAPIQLGLFPGFVVVADELAGDFDAALRTVSTSPEFGHVPGESSARNRRAGRPPREDEQLGATGQLDRRGAEARGGVVHGS